MESRQQEKWEEMTVRKDKVCMVILLVSLSYMSYAQEVDPLPGATEMSDNLLKRQAYVCENVDRATLSSLKRDLREADYLFRETSAKDRHKEACEKREIASKKLLQVLESCPHIQVVRMADQPVLATPLPPINLAGNATAFLFRVDNGDGPVRCLSRTFDLSVDAGTRLSIDVAAKGIIWVLAALDRIPQGRTSLEFKFSGAESVNRIIPFETVTMPQGMLEVKVLSDDTGESTPAMIRMVWKTDGSEVCPANALDFGLLFDKQGNASGLRQAQIPGKLGARYWCIPGPFQMALAPGEYDLTILRGAEHVPVQETLTVISNQTIARTYRPQRWVDMRKLGWYSGDDHVHTQILSDRDAGMVMSWIQAEDVRLANVVKMGDIYRTWFEQRGFGKSFRVEKNGYIVSPGQECPRTHAELGHTLSMNIKRMVRDTEQYYLYDTVFDEVHRQGGLSGYAHVNSGIFQVHRDMSINIPKEKIDFVELLQFADLGTNLYYDFLNLGFKVTASSGSDVPWGGSVGEGRVYAYIGNKRFTADRWFDAVRRGNTFVTNGLMLDFTVQGARPGDEVNVADSQPLRVKARVWGDSRRDVPTKLEIIVHGVPVKTVISDQTNQASLETDFTIPPDNGFWIAARAEGRDGTRAHTTPVYVVRKGFRFWKYDNVSEFITKREASLAEVEHIVAEAQAGRNSKGEVDINRPVTELAQQGPALLKRVEDAKKIYSELRTIAEHEAAARKTAMEKTTMRKHVLSNNKMNKDNTDTVSQLNLPDKEMIIAYEKAATQNVLDAVNPKVFFGYWSVCADGVGFGYGNTYPALDGHQMADALLWLGKIDVVKANWDYIRSFQRPNGQLPFAILPSMAGKMIGPDGCRAPVDSNGGLYRHWVPADPLRALSYPTYIQNADIIFRWTQDRKWLIEQLPSINLAADFLASLTTPDGAVAGAGYYVERPTRVEYDGVAQCHAMDAFRRIADLNRIAGNQEAADRYRQFADRIEAHFRSRFWVNDHFAEYIHPEHGIIATHGLTDVDWSAIATGIADTAQCAILWPQLKNEKKFRYGGMPTGIATHPETYEKWEFAYDDRMDLAAMGRVWYLECWARTRMGDADGLVDAIRQVCEAGQKNGYSWRERYNDQGGFGAEKYCEYPANLIRIIQRFLFGVEHRLDGALTLGPTVPDAFWDAGIGQTLSWGNRCLSYQMQRNRMKGKYVGQNTQELRVKLCEPPRTGKVVVSIDGHPAEYRIEDAWIVFDLPASSLEHPCRFTLRQEST